MMSIRYVCVNCGQKCKSADEYAGLAVNCSQCGTLLKIPQQGKGSAQPSEIHDSPPPLPKSVNESQFKLYQETVEQIPVSDIPPEPLIAFESRKVPETTMIKGQHPPMKTSVTPVPSKEAKTLQGENKMIKFTCPGCRATFEIDDTFAGKKIECGNCGKRLMVPSLEEIRALEAVERAAAASRQTPPPVPTARDTTIIKKVAVSNINKPAPPKGKNKFIEHVTRERMKYLFCIFILLFTGIVLGLVLKPNSPAVVESKEPEEVKLSLQEQAAAKAEAGSKAKREQEKVPVVAARSYSVKQDQENVTTSTPIAEQSSAPATEKSNNNVSNGGSDKEVRNDGSNTDRKAAGSEPSEGQPWEIPGLEMNFVYVAPGNFQMGSNDGESKEKPVHRVTISKGYWIGKYEVTQSEYEEIMGINPSRFKNSTRPVENVNWDEAVSFCKKLTERERTAGRLPGYEYRLPTEAEWEFAARGGTASKGYKYSGSDKLDNVARYKSNSYNSTWDVGSKSPNELGTFDMSGNVGEWCLDDLHDNYNGAPSDGSRWGDGKEIIRVTRGGDWGNNAIDCRVASRGGFLSCMGLPGGLGFRVALASTKGNENAQKKLEAPETATPASRLAVNAQDTGDANDDLKAFKSCREVAETGSAEEQYDLGLFYERGAGVARDLKEAAKWWRKAAEQGYAKAQLGLGMCYAKGEGVEKNDFEAIKWVHKAAEQGNAEAQYKLFLAYTLGMGVYENETTALQWLALSAKNGCAKAQYSLGKKYETYFKKPDKALFWYKKAAAQGDDEALKKIDAWNAK